MKLKNVLYILLLVHITACSTQQERNTQASPAQASQDSAQPIYIQPPQYPRQAALDGIEGYVTLSFLIDAYGRPTDIEIADSDPLGMFELAAIRSVSQWRFTPPENPNGKMHVHRLDFTLE